MENSIVQTDGNSCGVLICMNFIYLMKTKNLPTKLDYTNSDAPMLRRYMQHCIISVCENVNLLQMYENEVNSLEGASRK